MTEDRALPRILICTLIHDSAIELFASHADIDFAPGLSNAELTARIGHYEAIVVGPNQEVTGMMLERAVHLKIIARISASLQKIDIVAAQEHNIEVVNCPDAFSVQWLNIPWVFYLPLPAACP